MLSRKVFPRSKNIFWMFNLFRSEAETKERSFSSDLFENWHGIQQVDHLYFLLFKSLSKLYREIFIPKGNNQPNNGECIFELGFNNHFSLDK